MYLNIVPSIDYVNKGADWILDIFKRIESPFSKINDIEDIEYRNLFRLLFLFNSDNKYYALAMCLFKSFRTNIDVFDANDKSLFSRSRVYYLLHNMPVEYNSYLKLLDLDTDLGDKIRDVFDTWNKYRGVAKTGELKYMYSDDNYSNYLTRYLYKELSKELMKLPRITDRVQRSLKEDNLLSNSRNRLNYLFDRRTSFSSKYSGCNSLEEIVYLLENIVHDYNIGLNSFRSIKIGYRTSKIDSKLLIM